MANYYVRNGGNDNNTGLSDANAWETITQVNSINFANNDTINLKRGNIFTDTTLTLDNTAVGRNGITVQDYGAGNKPWINGNIVQPIIINHALIDLTLRNIDISGSDTTGNRCIIQQVNGLIIDGIDYNGHKDSSKYNRCNGINIAWVFGDVEIKNCHIQNAYKKTFLDSIRAWYEYDAHGILFWYPGDENVKTSGTINIHDNYIHDVYADCIQLAGVHTETNIYNNILGRFGENALDLKYSRYINVYNNELYHDDFGLHHGGGYYGCSVLASGGSALATWSEDYSSKYNIINSNYIHDCKWQGIGCIGDNGQIYSNYFKNIGTNILRGNELTVYDNVFESTVPIANEITYPGTEYEFDWSTRYFGIMASCIRIPSQFADNTCIYNNTVYVSSPNHLYGIAAQAHIDVIGSNIKNNIICMTEDSVEIYPLYIQDYDNMNNLPIINHNLFYGTHSNRIKIEETPNNWIIYDKSEQTMWRNAGHPGAIFADPKFVNPSIGNFNLQFDSLAIAAGVDVGLPFTGSAPDIGATLNLGDETMELIPRNEMNIIYVDSEELSTETGFPIRAAVNILDNDPNTHWHTEWYLTNPPHPHEVQVSLGNEYDVCAFRYLSRQDGNINGMIKDFEFYVSNDINNWGSPVATGTLLESTDLQEVTFLPKSGKYVRLVALSEIKGEYRTSMASFDVLFEPSAVDPCENVTCPDFCDGTTRYYNGTCDPSTGECVYDMELNSEDCEVKDNTNTIMAVVAGGIALGILLTKSK